MLDGEDNTKQQCSAGDGKSKYKAENVDVRGYVNAESTNKGRRALYVDSDSSVSLRQPDESTNNF